MNRPDALLHCVKIAKQIADFMLPATPRVQEQYRVWRVALGWSAIVSALPGDATMDTNTLLIIILIVLVLGGGGWYGRGRWY